MEKKQKPKRPLHQSRLCSTTNLTFDQRLLLDAISKKNTPEYNTFKTVEELQELSLVLTQKQLKPTKVSDQEVIDEIGDVLIRLEMLLKNYDLNLVKKRIDYKLSKFSEYVTKYNNI